MRKEIAIFLLVFVVVAAVYLATSAPGLGLIDSGELTTAAYTLGIAHPTGYPLYTILGRVWLALTPLRPDRAMVVFSVFCGALACGIMALIAQRFLDKPDSQSRWLLRIVLPVGAAIGFALTPAAWTSILFAEVYPLTWLIVVFLLWLTVLVLTPSPANRTSAGLLLLLFYVWGLGLGNHLTIVWYSPILLILLWRFVGASVHPVRVTAACIIMALLGTTTLLYLPIRSSLNPSLDWGNPESLSNLVRHLSAWQYQVWMFKGNLGDVLEKLLAFLARIPGEVGWMITLLAVIGLWLTVRRRLLIGYLMLVVWLIGTAYNINYDIPDISSYFLVFYCPLFLLAVLGIQLLCSTIEKLSWNRISKSVSLALVVLLIPLTSVLAGYRVQETASSEFVRRFTQKVVATLPDSALVFHGNWDIQSPFLYYQQVENLRPDVVILDLGLMQRSWYIEQERRNHPDIFIGSERQVDAFLRAVEPFESGKPFDGHRLEAVFVDMHNHLIQEQLPRRPVYIRDVEDVGHPGIGAPFPKRPGGYFMRIAGNDSIQESMIESGKIANQLLTFSVRERRLLASAAQSALLQAQQARLMNDTLRFTAALNTALTLSGEDPRVQEHVRRLRSEAGAAQP